MTLTTTAPAAPGRRGAERWVVALVLALLAGVVLARAPAYWRGDEPLGADSSSHILASATLAQHLQQGSSGWWMPHLSLGFPLAHYYQPLPHFATALLALALGGPERSALAYKVLIVVLLCLAPIALYAGLRRLDFSRAAAIVAAIALATLSTRQEWFGLTARQYLFVGLYTLLWGSVFLPLALAEGVRFIQGRGRASLAAGAFGLLFLSHGLLALGLIPVYTLVALFVPAREGRVWGRIARLTALGALSGVLIAFWLLPQLACSDYFNGWPFLSGSRRNVDGFGLWPLLLEWVQGPLLDLRRWPVLTVLSLLGAVCAALGARRHAHQRLVLLGLALFLVFTAGRTTFGRAVDWLFPPNTRIEGLLRWVAMLHLFLVLAAGLGAELAVRGLQRLAFFARHGWLSIALVCAALLGFALPRHMELLAMGLTTFPEALDRPAFVRVAEAIAADPAEGRVFTGEALGHESHWAKAYLTMLTGKPMTLGSSVGNQDSLNSYYLWKLELRDPQRGPALARLFDIRYVLLQPGLSLGALQPQFLARQGPYEAVRLPGEYGLFDLIQPPEVLAPSSPRDLRPTCLRWMMEEYPRGARFLRLPDPIRARFPTLPSGNLEYEAAPAKRERAVQPSPPVRGELLEERAELARFEARARLEDAEAWLLLKVTPHPFWEAEVDGAPAPIYYLSPAFMGLPLDAGEHRVVFTFRAPAWQKGLLLLSPLLLGTLFLVDARARARKCLAPPTAGPAAGPSGAE